MLYPKKSTTLKALSALCLALTALGAHADTITMKNGEVYQGSVVSETLREYTLSIYVSPGVRSDKVVKKLDVKSIQKPDAAQLDYDELKALFPLADLMSEEEYSELINKKLIPFPKKYPLSKYKKDVQRLLKTAVFEYKAIQKGAKKINGKVIKAEDYQLDQFNLDSRILFKKMYQQAKAGNYNTALRIQEQLHADYKGTTAYNNSITLTSKILPIYKKQLEKLAANVSGEIAKRDKSLSSMSEDESRRIKSILDTEDKIYQLSLTRAKNSKTKWLPTNKYHAETIQTVLKTIGREQAFIAATRAKIDPTKNAGTTYKKLGEALKNGDIETANTLLREFKGFRPGGDYYDNYKKKFNFLKQEQRNTERTKHNRPTPAPEPTTTQPKEEKEPAKAENKTLNKLDEKTGINKRQKHIERLAS